MIPQATFLRRVLAIGTLSLAAACSEETVVTPVFGEGCTVGALTAGESVTGAFHEASPCIDARHFYSGYRVPYESYAVRLEAGKAYMFRQEHIPDAAHEGRNELDAMLAIWGRNESGASVPLAVSDQEGGDDDAELHFIAPRSGMYHVVAASYYNIEEDRLGGYRLLSAECPVLGRIEGTGEYDFDMTPSDCLRHDPLAAYRYVRIDAKPFERITIELDADEFTPAWEVFGPGMDTYAYLYEESRHDSGYGNGTITLTTGAVGGSLTLAVGIAESDGPDLSFEVAVSRAPVPPVEMLAAKQAMTPKLVVPRR